MSRWPGVPRVLLVLALGAGLVGCSDGEPGSGRGWNRVSPDELRRRLDREDVFLVNVHVPYEGEIAGTDAFIPYDELEARVEELPDDPRNLVIYCRSGSMSTAAAEDLVEAGVTGFAELEGGFLAWEAAGLLLERDAAG